MANWRGRLDSLNLGYKLLELLDCVQPESGLWYYQRGFWRGQSLGESPNLAASPTLEPRGSSQSILDG